MLQIVIPLHHGGGKEGKDTELRHALRGWAENMDSPYAVTIVGRKLPEWISGVHHIVQEKGDLKTALKLAAAAYPDGFLWAYDDCFPIRRMTAAEAKTPIARAEFSKLAPTTWSKNLNRIHSRLEKEGIQPVDFSRPHCPYFFTKEMVDEAFEDWPAMTGKFPFETWILSKRRVPYATGLERQYYKAFTEPPAPHHRYAHCSDAGWTPAFKAWLSVRFPNPSPFEKTRPIPMNIVSDPAVKISVHTLRTGKGVWWIDACSPSLEAWCGKHGHSLRVWSEKDIPKGYPHLKFCQIDMLKAFLKTDSTHFFYIDADVYIDAEAPAHPSPLLPGLHAMPDYPCRIVRNWPRWVKTRHPRLRIPRGLWTYCNAGIWLCDRTAAQQILNRAEPPFFEGCMDQNDWNRWCAMAAKDGMAFNPLPVIWNAYHYHESAAHFYHISGKNKEAKFADRIAKGHIPASAAAALLPPPQIQNQQSTIINHQSAAEGGFSLAPYAYTADAKGWSMDDLHIHLLRHACTLDTGIPPEKRIVVEIGAFQGRSTAALVHALESGDIGELHIVEVKPTPQLLKLIHESSDVDRIHLHTRPFWELDIPCNHLAFIDGDHRWPALADALAALTRGIPIIAMHDSHSHTIPIADTWGAHTAANILRTHPHRHTWQDAEKRPGMRTDRGFFVNSIPDIREEMAAHLFEIQP